MKIWWTRVKCTPHWDINVVAFRYYWRLTFWRRRYGAAYSAVEFQWGPK